MKALAVSANFLITILVATLLFSPAIAQTTKKAASGSDSSLIVHCQNYQIKPRLNDPGSYKRTGRHVERHGSVATVYIRFSAKNAFGGRLTAMYACEYDRAGNFKKIYRMN